MEWIQYRKFFDEGQANALAEKLNASKISAVVIYSMDDLNFIYGDKQFKNQYIVNLQKEDFEKADLLLLQSSAEVLSNADKDHYLFGFSDDELFEILAKPDEWNEYDYQLAIQILNDRGKDISATAIALLKKQRLNDLAKPDESQQGWIYAAYFFALLGSLLGTFLGYYLMTSKKTLPNGERVHVYNRHDRHHGLIIMVVGIVAGFVQAFLFYYRGPYNPFQP